MQIVIDLPDYDYRHIKEYYEKNDDVEATYSYIYHGIPLPKGHGRLGDLDALRDEVSSCGMNDYEPSDFIDEIDRADVIIEADVPNICVGKMAESEDKE